MAEQIVVSAPEAIPLTLKVIRDFMTLQAVVGNQNMVDLLCQTQQGHDFVKQLHRANVAVCKAQQDGNKTLTSLAYFAHEQFGGFTPYAIDSIKSWLVAVHDLTPDQADSFPLSEVVARLRAREAAAARQMRTGPHHPNGPELPDRFWWEGKPYPLEAKPCQLLSCLWGRDSVSEDEAIEAVWGHDADRKEGALKATLHKVNHCLEVATVPWSYGQKGGIIVKK
jgi:hypothetical protein